MWTKILDFFLSVIVLLGDLGSWLFTPVNLNVASETLDSFYNDMNRLGLSNVPTWLYKIFQVTSNPIYVTPIEIFSVGFVTTIFIWAIVKTIWSN